MSNALDRLLQGLGDVVFPPVCVHCKTIVETEVMLAGARPRSAAFGIYAHGA